MSEGLRLAKRHEDWVQRGRPAQLWQQARISRLDEMVGNTAALAALREIQSGFVLIEGPIGTGKTIHSAGLGKRTLWNEP